MPAPAVGGKDGCGDSRRAEDGALRVRAFLPCVPAPRATCCWLQGPAWLLWAKKPLPALQDTAGGAAMCSSSSNTPPQTPPTLQVDWEMAQDRAPVWFPHPSTGQPKRACNSCFAKPCVCRRYVGRFRAPWLSLVPSRPVSRVQEESKLLCTAVTSHPPLSHAPSSPKGSCLCL